MKSITSVAKCDNVWMSCISSNLAVDHTRASLKTRLSRHRARLVATTVNPLDAQDASAKVTNVRADRDHEFSAALAPWEGKSQGAVEPKWLRRAHDHSEIGDLTVYPLLGR